MMSKTPIAERRDGRSFSMKTLATNPNSTTSPRMGETRLADYPRRRAFAAVARNHAAVNFDYHKIVPQYETIYERVLEAP